MTICDLVGKTTGGLQGAAGQAAAGLGNALNALGAADIAIKIGSGGQAGVGDLPGLFAATKGIECYSPELGDSIYVTPLQWYANGMKCDGLRDPDREKIKKIQDELDKKIQERQKVKQGGEGFLPQDVNKFLPPELQNPLNQFKNSKEKVKFTQDGVLKTESIRHYNVYYQGNLIPREDPLSIKELAVLAGQYLEFFTFINATGEIIRWAIQLIRDPAISQLSDYDRYFLSPFDKRATGLNSGSGGTAKFTNPDYVVYELQPGSIKFTPSTPLPPNPAIPEIISPPPNTDPEEPCSMTCSCGQIQQMMKQQQRLNGNIEQLIKEIHKAVAASLFVARYPYKPEQNIEKIGKQLYGANPGRGGVVPVGNLLDAVECLISSHYHRMGLHRFPANVPDSLIPKTNKMLEAIDRDYIDIHDMAGFLEWMAKCEDERGGEWPIRFKVTDDGKEKDVYLWNQAEAIADIYGAILKVVEDADQSVHWGLRSTTEASKAGNASLKVLHLLQEFVKFSGAMTAQDFIKVKSTFTPDPMVAQTTEEMLKPSEQDLQVTNIIDGRTLLGLLLNISYWSQIGGRAVYGNLDNNPSTGKPHMPGDAIKEMKKKNKAADKEWDKWKAERKQQSTIPKEQQPPGGIQPPDITEVQKPKN